MLELTNSKDNFDQSIVDAAMRLKLPVFKDGVDIVSFIIRFKRVAALLKLTPESYAVRMGSLLSGKTLKIYAALSPETTDDYNSLKAVLLNGFNKIPESYRDEFRSARVGSSDTYQQFSVQLGRLFDHWFDSSGIPWDFDDMCEFLIVDQLLSTLPVPLHMHIKELDKHLLSDIVKLHIVGRLLIRVILKVAYEFH